MGLRDDLSERAERRVGTVIKGKYRLNRILGVGGMAVVYAATHRNKKRFAIKMLHPEIALDREVTLRFTREGYVANTVGHPGAVEVFDDDVTTDGAPFLVMELLQGETVDERWDRKGRRLPPSEVLPVVDQLLDVLVAAHEKGIVHRDLKPENLFLTRDGRLKVLDFGIARLREVSRQGSAATQAGSLLGTPAFMAPEQSRGRWDEVDGQTDIWAVGAVLFTTLSGRYVHEAETVNEQIIMAATVPAPSIGAIVPEMPRCVVELVDRALAFAKHERWPNARAMQRAVRAVVAELRGGDGQFTLPQPSVSNLRDFEVETVLAPSGSNPSAAAFSQPVPNTSISEETDPATSRSRPETLTTARAITSNARETTGPPTYSRRRVGHWIALGAFFLGVVGAALTLGRPTRETRASAGASPASARSEAPTAAAAPVSPHSESSHAIAPVEAPSTARDAQAPQKTVRQPPRPRASGRPARSGSHPVPPAASHPAAPVPKPPERPGPGISPFDRRH